MHPLCSVWCTRLNHLWTGLSSKGQSRGGSIHTRALNHLTLVLNFCFNPVIFILNVGPRGIDLSMLIGTLRLLPQQQQTLHGLSSNHLICLWYTRAVCYYNGPANTGWIHKSTEMELTSKVVHAVYDNRLQCKTTSRQPTMPAGYHSGNRPGVNIAFSLYCSGLKFKVNC